MLQRRNFLFGKNLERCELKLLTKVTPLFYGQNINKYRFEFFKKEAQTSQTLLLTFLNLVPIFRVVSTQYRGALTKYDEQGHETDWERETPEIYDTSDGFYEIFGPILCMYDLKVFCTLISLYLERKIPGVSLSCNCTDIARSMDLSKSLKTNSLNTKSIKRSISRLQKATINKTGTGTNSYLPEFYGSLIRKNGSDIEFNQYLVKHFVHRSFSKVSLDLILSLKPYELKIYSYVLVRGFKSGIDYKASTIFDCVYANQSEYSRKDKLTHVGKAIKGLIGKGLLKPQSGLIKSSSYKIESHYLLKLA